VVAVDDGWGVGGGEFGLDVFAEDGEGDEVRAFDAAVFKFVDFSAVDEEWGRRRTQQ